MAAALVAHLVNVSGKSVRKTVTGDQLLGFREIGSKPSKGKKKVSRKTKEQFIDEARARNRTYADYKAEHGI